MLLKCLPFYKACFQNLSAPYTLYHIYKLTPDTETVFPFFLFCTIINRSSCLYTNLFSDIMTSGPQSTGVTGDQSER